MRALVGFGMAAMVGLSACNVGSDWEESDDPDAVEEVSQAIINNVQSYTDTLGEAGLSTNGKKVVVAGGMLHATYEVGGAILYTSSTDGVTWTAPVTLWSFGAQSPTIAVDSMGRIGVAYAMPSGNFGGALNYSYKVPGGSWVHMYNILPNYVAKTPSMIADGPDMHLVFTSGSKVYYMQFATNNPGSPIPEHATEAPPGGTVGDFLPSIARSVAPGGGKRSRIALIRQLVTSSTQRMAVHFVERTGAFAFTDLGLFQTGTGLTGIGTAHSLSMDANPTTGDYFIAASFSVGATARTYLYRSNSLSAGPITQFQFSTVGSQVSMAAATIDCVNQMRLQWSPLAYGSTNYRTGTWSSGPSPTWIDAAPVQMAASGLASTSMLSSILLAGTNTRRSFRSFHDTSNGGNSFTLQIDHVSGPNPQPCN
ncbi:MAG: hypothetical protein IPK82_26725 [Polyangiaceae bacterium]|nr:hypothetical protein [Polyangiaceae bacterium]